MRFQVLPPEHLDRRPESASSCPAVLRVWGQPFCGIHFVPKQRQLTSQVSFRKQQPDFTGTLGSEEILTSFTPDVTLNGVQVNGYL